MKIDPKAMQNLIRQIYHPPTLAIIVEYRAVLTQR